MASTTSSPAGTAGTSAPGPQKRILHPGSVGMLLGGLLTLVGSLLPWVMTPLGNLAGTAGPGLWTLCAGFLGIAGAVLPYRRVALAHCLLAGGVAGVIVGWQVARLAHLSATTDAWGQLLPGMGLVMVAGGTVVLLRTGIRLLRTPATTT
ncbi:hypothetical protein [Georgenia alba]|uniref:Uncharacterized protein n=1 Tax=Georgenia alba TaxID=2233858 RepID=A0ABW2Q9W3_9MICO